MLDRALAMLLGLFLTTSLAIAEPAMMGTVTNCETENGKMLQLVQEKYGEIPLSRAMGLIQSINGKWMEVEVYIFLNPESKSYSVIALEPESGIQCLVIAGGGMEPIFSGKPL